jgi:PAS domain S-box-containing protein
VLAAVEERRRTGKFFTEMTCVKADGTHFEAEVSSFIFTDSHGNQRTSMIVRDITDRKKREIELARLNRTLRALSNSSLAILRAKDSTDYMQQVCRIIMDDCQYTMVWIGLAENDDYKTIRPAAYAGFEEGYLDTLKITWADTPRGHGPTGTAVRTGKVTFCRNMLTDPKFEPWRAEAIKRGYASSMAIPMKVDGKIVGAITIYSREPDPFSTEEVTLLEELTSDFSFGLSSLQLREENEKGEAIQAWLASFPEKNPQPIVEVDEAGKIYYQNPAAKQLLPDLLKKGKSHPWLIHLDQYFEEIHAGKISISSAEVGLGEKHFLQNITFFPGEKRIRIYGTDITAWKKAEATQAWMASFPDIYPWPIVEVDSKGKVFYQNPACRRMFPDLEEKGKHHPWLRNIGEYFQEAQGGKSLIRSKQIEVEGSHFLQFNNYISESGRVRIYSTDISERVYAEEMQAWLASFPDIYPWPIVEVDSAGKVYYQNPACRALFPDLEEKGKSHPWLGHLNEYFDEAQGGSSAISSKEINVGGAYYLQINNYIEENKSVRIYGMDISSRKQAEAAQAWLASFPDNYPWPIVEVDSMGQVFYQNPACRTMFPDLEKRGKAHPWLRYIEEYFKEAHSGASEIASRQIPVGDSHFLQINYLVPEADRVRIYGTDISKRVQAEEMQAWLASFPDNYPWPIVELDSEGKVFYQNHACRILFPDLEEKGRSHPWLSNLNEYFEEAQGGTSAIPSKEIKAGGTYYLQINNYIVENKRVRIYGTDISSRKRAEAAQAWLASFPDNYPWPIVEVDADGRVFYQNPACRAMFPDLVEKGKAHPWLCHIGEYFEEAEEGESLIASRQVEIGDSHFLQTNNYIPESGRVRIYATDISKRVQAEENRDRLAAILESTPDMVATFTLEGKVLYLNKAGRDTLGLPPDVDFSNYRISPHMPQWSTQLITKEAFPEVLRTGVWAGETMILDKNGKEIPISQSILAHRESNGEIAFLSTVARDISQRKQIEDALIQSGAELEQRVKERTQELNESHEKLRQQIEERQRLADSLHDAVNQSLFSAGLIAEVLPRLWERDQVEARKSLQDLRRLTRGAQAEMRALLNELRPSMIADNSLDYLLGILAETFSGRTNIPVSLSTPKNVKLPDEVKTVYYRVCQEALNNVAKHANASQVQIRLTQHDGFTDLQISDNGCGFDPDDANISHYGLGMIRERMNSIHGQLSVESKKSKGCMIHIHWSEKDAREEE